MVNDGLVNFILGNLLIGIDHEFYPTIQAIEDEIQIHSGRGLKDLTARWTMALPESKHKFRHNVTVVGLVGQVARGGYRQRGV